ncbi:MAG: hypothetical protein IJ385_04825 [Ruminiclostridium sp.]|nr:hypothetical protein [Ruminiclostridium sp.]
MRAVEYFKRMFEIFYLFAAGLIIPEERVRIERGSAAPLRLKESNE